MLKFCLHIPHVAVLPSPQRAPCISERHIVLHAFACKSCQMSCRCFRHCFSLPLSMLHRMIRSCPLFASISWWKECTSLQYAFAFPAPLLGNELNVLSDIPLYVLVLFALPSVTENTLNQTRNQAVTVKVILL